VSARKVQNRERSFGISVGAVLCVIAIALVWRGRVMRGEIVGGIGAVLLVLGYLKPALLKYPSDAWWAFAGVLGWINARVLLSLLFFLLLTPVSLVWRLTGTDPLSRRRSTWRGWQPYPERYRNSRHYERMF
jgi:Saxitoxin biosynthesis operon protein SxtJ